MRVLGKKEKQPGAGVFWQAWVDADEPERIRLVGSLMAFDEIKEPLMKRSFLRLVNSYFEDLYDFVQKGVPVGDRYARRKESVDTSVSQVQP